MSLVAKGIAALVAAAATTTLTATPALPEARVLSSDGFAQKKGQSVDATDAPPLLGTLVQVHTGEHMVLDDETPTEARFSALLSDRSTGDAHALDGRLIGLLRELARKHPMARVELVSGYRSWKLNEMLRKKGHHVASHSQHSLGNACDFRIVPDGADLAIDPRIIEGEIRALGWKGGVGVYPTSGDWFVHADVGRERRWEN